MSLFVLLEQWINPHACDRGAPLSGINFAEGGQSSTGSILSWARNIFGASDIEYSVLDAEAAKVAPGCEGLIALETFQGSRTPITDPKAKVSRAVASFLVVRMFKFLTKSFWKGRSTWIDTFAHESSHLACSA